MSVLGAVCNFDAVPVELATLAAMADGMRYQRRGAGPLRSWTAGPVGLLCCSSGFVPDVELTSGGGRDADRACWIVADCRLDNREQLCGRLGCDRNISDAQLVLGSYLKWGSGCASHLDGDFSFAIWDPREQRLLFARDAFGVRQLFYSVTTTEVVVASTLEGVLRARRLCAAVNVAALRDFVAGRMARWTDETVRASVYRVPPGSTVSVRSGTTVVSRNYQPGQRPATSLRGPSEVADCFAELLERSLRARLRGIDSVGVLLSGGIDSAVVACEAARLVNSECGVTVSAYTAVFNRTPSADERTYLDAVLRFRPQLRSRQLVCDDRWAFKEFGDDGGYPFDEPEAETNRALLRAVLEPAGQDRCAAVLSGFWADQVLASGAYSTPRYLWDLPAARLLREWPHFRAASGDGWRFFARLILGGLVEFRRARLGLDTALPAGLSRRGKDTVRLLASGPTAAGMALVETLSAGAGVQWRVPFLDKDLVDFVLRLPTEVFIQYGETKSILRAALAERLPRAILRRRSAGHFSDLSRRGLREERHRLEPLMRGERVLSWQLCQPRFVEEVSDAVRVQPNYANVGRLARLVSTERWLALNT